MILETLDPKAALRHEEFHSFLSQDSNTRKRLGPAQATAFRIMQVIGNGAEGLILLCRVPQSRQSFALKLFFQNQPPLPTQNKIWPLKLESRYYAGCAYASVHFSKPSASPHHLPRMPFEKWIQLFETCPSGKGIWKSIEADLSFAPPEIVEKEELMSLLEPMCAKGWVAFDINILNKLYHNLPRNAKFLVAKFTGKIIVGIVKPFFEKDGSIESDLERQIQTMLLMRSLNWGLRDVQPRNWINGVLVDGGDVETQPRYPRHLERTWVSAFFAVVKVYASDKKTREGHGMKEVQTREGNNGANLVEASDLEKRELRLRRILRLSWVSIRKDKDEVMDEMNKRRWKNWRIWGWITKTIR
ncbi:hypothetical protein BU24DRAFT_484933 [Aaosphaeria arxii CBS 175.79]|uniref:Protein kinase domain-containing protein n=1 Tax=Aaosphaeria arxii CBS 175.79 TaxID=1450172 RepID=A0A6A5XJF2_9PLEO|nr:uncharacterized protein BU24DRAFT_484933 [Aaosphaeria arxii CBS 175.79]KAF2012989.1 hypothetical protein BU24DRAFT_484933 [Aaosphaeria arxii CBS 175.79]